MYHRIRSYSASEARNESPGNCFEALFQGIKDDRNSAVSDDRTFCKTVNLHPGGDDNLQRRNSWTTDSDRHEIVESQRRHSGPLPVRQDFSCPKNLKIFNLFIDIFFEYLYVHPLISQRNSLPTKPKAFRPKPKKQLDSLNCDDRNFPVFSKYFITKLQFLGTDFSTQTSLKHVRPHPSADPTHHNRLWRRIKRKFQNGIRLFCFAAIILRQQTPNFQP